MTRPARRCRTPTGSWARRLVGTLAHPLNRPRFDAGRCRVIGGYAILQPRVRVEEPDAGGTPFSRIFGGCAGIDPYLSAASDVEQDLFGEGRYVGKGIF